MDDRVVDEIVGALTDQQAELAGLLAPLADVEWAHPSPCEGWTVADVVLHVAQTNEMAIASVDGRLAEWFATRAGGFGSAASIDDGAELMVVHERGQAGVRVRERWQASADAQERSFRECDLHARVDWVAGQLSARTLAATRLSETWIHSGDVAAAFGRELEATDRLEPIARLAWRTLPYAFARAERELTGPVAFELVGPNGDAWTFAPKDDPVTVIRGNAVDLCAVAARRADPGATSLQGEGPDADAVLELVRTYA